MYPIYFEFFAECDWIHRKRESSHRIRIIFCAKMFQSYLNYLHFHVQNLESIIWYKYIPIRFWLDAETETDVIPLSIEWFDFVKSIAVSDFELSIIILPFPLMRKCNWIQLICLKLRVCGSCLFLTIALSISHASRLHAKQFMSINNCSFKPSFGCVEDVGNGLKLFTYVIRGDVEQQYFEWFLCISFGLMRFRISQHSFESSSLPHCMMWKRDRKRVFSPLPKRDN